MNIEQLEQKYDKLDVERKQEIISNTIWRTMSEYEAEREQGDAIAETASELAEKPIMSVVSYFNGMSTSEDDDHAPIPVIWIFLTEVLK